jgi:hypothetical protein
MISPKGSLPYSQNILPLDPLLSQLYTHLPNYVNVSQMISLQVLYPIIISPCLLLIPPISCLLFVTYNLMCHRNRHSRGPAVDFGHPCTDKWKEKTFRKCLSQWNCFCDWRCFIVPWLGGARGQLWIAWSRSVSPLALEMFLHAVLPVVLRVSGIDRSQLQIISVGYIAVWKRFRSLYVVIL